MHCTDRLKQNSKLVITGFISGQLVWEDNGLKHLVILPLVISQSRILFYLCVCVCVCVCVCYLLSRGQLFATTWTTAHQASLSMRFSRQGYWSGLPFPFPGDLPNPGTESGSPALQADSLPTKLQGRPLFYFLLCRNVQHVYKNKNSQHVLGMSLLSMQTCFTLFSLYATPMRTVLLLTLLYINI